MIGGGGEGKKIEVGCSGQGKRKVAKNNLTVGSKKRTA